jgi:hypothetical protein
MHIELKQLQHDVTLTENKKITVSCTCTISDINYLTQRLSDSMEELIVSEQLQSDWVREVIGNRSTVTVM